MKSLKIALISAATISSTAPVYAAGVYDTITAAVNWTDAVTAVGVIAAALALFLVFKKGARGVLAMIGG